MTLTRVCALLLVFGLVRSVAAVEFFFDDFEDYTDEFDVPSDVEVELAGWLFVDVNDPVESSTWTITNPGGRASPPGEDGAPSFGAFLISDSDAQTESNPTGSGMSHDVWSPEIDVEGDVVWLHFSCAAVLNNNGKAVFDVDVTTDDGTNWTNIFRRVAPSRVEAEPVVTTENADGVFQRLHLDVGSHLGGANSFKFRLRHFEPNFDWWIAIDDVIVDDQPPALGGSVNLLGEESFDTGIPDTWTINGLGNGNNTWTTADPCARSVSGSNGGAFPYQDGNSSARLGTAFAIMDSDCDPDLEEDEFLITPVVDCTLATDVFLHFKSETVHGAILQEVLVSLDGGVTFDINPLFSYSLGAGYDPGEDPSYAERVFRVPSAAGEPEVAFAFHHTGNNNWWWGIDDVKISANGDGLPIRTCANREFRVGAFDPQNVSVTMTWRSIEGDEGFRVLANGNAISGDLPANTTSFTDNNPPAGGTIEYSLESLIGGAVEQTCVAPEIEVLSCPGDLSCCPDADAGTVSLSWRNGANVAGTGWRITRNGVPIRTVPLTESSFVDSPAPGTYEYTLQLNGGDAAQCPDLPLTCRVTLPGEGILFAEDFNCYQDDDAVMAAGWEIREENEPNENAAWTVTNPGARGNPPRRDGSPSDGNFMVSDSDAAGGADEQGTGMSHDLWSPSFSTVGADTVWLHMACVAVLNNNGLCVFDVDVTTDDGATFTNVFRRVAPARTGFEPVVTADIPEDLPGGPQIGNADAFFGMLDIDLSAVAANQPSVRFRVRHFEPDDDWWIAIDDIVVDQNPVREGATQLLDEDFSDGISDEWEIRSEADDAAIWRVEDLCSLSLLNSAGGVFPDGADGRQLHHMDTTFAHVFGDDFCTFLPQDEYLITPALDLTGATNVYLAFESATVLTGATPEVLLSLDGGDTFDGDDPIFSYQRGAGALFDAGNGEMYYNEYVFEVPAAADQAEVAFAFHFLNLAGDGTGWAVDNVRVSADGLDGGGTPFRRGDVNATESVNLTDGIFLLNFLFLGGPPPPCLDAADANDDGDLNITTGVYLFNFLFLGGPPPPAPGHVTCGSDGTPETTLGCLSYENC